MTWDELKGREVIAILRGMPEESHEFLRSQGCTIKQIMPNEFETKYDVYNVHVKITSRGRCSVKNASEQVLWFVELQDITLIPIRKTLWD